MTADGRPTAHAQVVNVALPDIGSSLGGGLSGLQWVVMGYTLGLGGSVAAAAGPILGGCAQPPTPAAPRHFGNEFCAEPAPT
jgi:hypothetical protein